MTKSRRLSVAQENPEAIWFGEERVRPEEKTSRVRQVFDSVASRYDLMNDLMSGGLHRLWKDEFVSRVRPRAREELLDVAGGTGDIAMRCVRRSDGQAKVTVCDLNAEMMKHGRDRMIDAGLLTGIDWVNGNAEELPFEDCSFDVYTIAFGLRNVTRIDKALGEAVRVLKPGGRFFCLEFSPGVNDRLKTVYESYCDYVLPFMGQFVANDRNSYQYLAESIRKFPLQPQLAARMERAGLRRANWHNLTGGIAVIHSGWKV